MAEVIDIKTRKPVESVWQLDVSQANTQLFTNLVHLQQIKEVLKRTKVDNTELRDAVVELADQASDRVAMILCALRDNLTTDGYVNVMCSKSEVENIIYRRGEHEAATLIAKWAEPSE